jgi:hypothetical protein
MLKQIQELHDQFVKIFTEYQILMDEYYSFNGQKITEENLSEVNQILKNIGAKFTECYPVLHYINEQHNFASKAIFDYHSFIENLKKNGAEIINDPNEAKKDELSQQ